MEPASCDLTSNLTLTTVGATMSPGIVRKRVVLRTVLAIVAGVVVALATVFATDALFHQLASLPRPQTSDADVMRAYVAGQPAWLLALMVAGWSLAAALGGFVAARFARHDTWPGWVVVLLLLAATAFNFTLVDHPLWMVVASLAGIVIAGVLGIKVARYRR